MLLKKNKIYSLDFFKNLSNSQFDLLSEISSMSYYDKEYILYYEKTKIKYLYFLVDGLAKSYKIDKYDNEIFLYYIQNNSIISEISTVYDDILTTYSNISFIEKSLVLTIDYKLFKNYFLDTNILNKEFTNEIITRGKKLEILINREFIFEAVAKVAMMLGSDLAMFNRLKRHDVALMLHIQPATLSRVLNRLKKDTIIEIYHGDVSIIDKTRLETIYQD